MQNVNLLAVPNASYLIFFPELSLSHRGIATRYYTLLLCALPKPHITSDHIFCQTTWEQNRVFSLLETFACMSVIFKAVSRRPKYRQTFCMLFHCLDLKPWAFFKNFALFVGTPELPMESRSNVLPTDYRCKQWKYSTKDLRTLLLNAKPPGYYVSVALMFCFYMHNRIHPPKTWFL